VVGLIQINLDDQDLGPLAQEAAARLHRKQHRQAADVTGCGMSRLRGFAPAHQAEAKETGAEEQ
jgi:hypothetical protein